MKQSRLRGSADDLVQERSIAVMGLHRKFNHHTGADAFAGGDIKLAFPLAEDIEPLMYIGYAVTFAGADIQLGQLLCRFGRHPVAVILDLYTESAGGTPCADDQTLFRFVTVQNAVEQCVFHQRLERKFGDQAFHCSLIQIILHLKLTLRSKGGVTQYFRFDIM